MMTSAHRRYGAVMLGLAVAAACSGGSDFDLSFFSRPDNPGDETTPSTSPENPFDIPSGPAVQAASTVATATASASTGVGGAGGCDTCNDIVNGVATTVDNLCAAGSQEAWDALELCVCSTSTCNMFGAGGAPPCENECINPFPFSSQCVSCAQTECTTEVTTCLSN